METTMPEASMEDAPADATQQPGNSFASAQQNGVMPSYRTYRNQTKGSLQQPHDDAEVTARMKIIYHQTSMPLIQSAAFNAGNLWKLPEPMSGADEAHAGHLIGRRFYDIRNLIIRYWDINPSEVVPPEMRDQTPYSLALFLAIRRLASNTKHDLDRGQRALLTAWRDRVGRGSNEQVDARGIQIQQTKVVLGPGSEGCEEFIQETDCGLMLDDVEAASKIAKKMSRGEKIHPSAGKVPSGPLRDKKGAIIDVSGGTTRASRAQMRAQRKKAQQNNKAAHGAEIEKRQKEPKLHAAQSKVSKRLERKKEDKMQSKLSKGEKGYKLLQFLQGDDDDDNVTLNGTETTKTDAPAGDVAPPNSPEPNPMQSSRFADPDVVDLTMRDERHAAGVPKKKSREDRHNDRILSQMFNRVDMASDKGLGAKKEKKMLESASKKEGSLPSDRVKLAEIPTLYAQQGQRMELPVRPGMGVDGGKSIFADGHGGGDMFNGVGLRNNEVITLSDDDEL